MVDFSGEKILVVGMGRSGLAAAAALARRNARVTLCDRKPEASMPEDLAQAGVQAVIGYYPEGSWDRVVVSPGVPMDEILCARP
jgi:UDP-N-acetylmuramoylalanine--D-glutamate ligase